MAQRASHNGSERMATRARKPYAPADRDFAMMADKRLADARQIQCRKGGLEMEERRQRFIGLDCGQDTHHAQLLDQEGQFGTQVQMRNRRDSIQDGFGNLLVQTGGSAGVVVVVESRRSYGRLAADIASELGCEIRQVGTVALSRYREVEGQPRKNDPWDAFLAARMGFVKARGVRSVPEVTSEERALSRLTRAHRRLMEERKRRGAQLGALFLELSPEMLHSKWEGPKVTSKAMLYILRRWPGLVGLDRAHHRSIEVILRQCRYGERAGRMAKTIRAAAKRISMVGAERKAISIETRLLVREVLSIDDELKEVYREVVTLVDSHPVGIKLLEIPSIGYLTAGVLVSELLPIARQATEAQSATYSGVTPLGRQTGKGAERAHLVQGINKRVLTAFYETSVNAVKSDPISKRYFLKKLQDYAGHPKPAVAAYIALCRQRHKMIYKIMTTDARYDRDLLLARHFERLDAEKEAATGCGS
jgi:transposase